MAPGGPNSRRPDLSYGIDYSKKFNLPTYGLFDLNLSHRYIGDHIDWTGSKNAFVKSVDLVEMSIKKNWYGNLISLNFKGVPVLGLANFPILKKYYLNTSNKLAYVIENGRKKKIQVNTKASFSNMKMSAAFHGGLTLKQQSKIPQILKRMQFPCADALSYSHFTEGKVDAVLQCSNKIWDIHPLIPIIRAAGGIVTTWSNDNAVKAGNILCSSNKSIHNKLLKILKPVSK